MGKYYYRVNRGLGKDEIGLVVRRCLRCGKTMGLWAVDEGGGNKAYACKDCKDFYKRWKK